MAFNPDTWYLLALAGVLGAALIGCRRSAIAGRLDLFHPLVFPSIYIGIATILPGLWISRKGGWLGSLNETVVSDRTPMLLALSVFGFLLGAAFRFRPRRKGAVTFDANTVKLLGRSLVLVGALILLRALLSGGAATRGLGQDVYTSDDSLLVMGMLLSFLGVLLILIGGAKRHRMLGWIDWALLVTVVGIMSMSGHRATSLKVILLIVVVFARKNKTTVLPLLVFPLILFGSNAVLDFRNVEVGQVNEGSFLEKTLGDLGSVTFTTGATDKNLAGQYKGGSTIVAGVVRQLPSAVAIPLWGQPNDTGAYEFRALIGVGANQGYGFSIPAEGVINFGALGAFGLPFLLGLLFAFSYSRFDLKGSFVANWIYPIVVASLPYVWRSDALGAIKSILYPVIGLYVALVLARSTYNKHVAIRER